MKTTANVWLLPTEKSLLHVSNNKLIESIELTKASDLYKSTPHYLYITLPQSDLEISKIKEGDWCIYHNSFGAIIFCQAYKHKDDIRMLFDNGTHNREIGEGITPMQGECEKIIATTDPTLLLKLTDKSLDGIKYNHLPIYIPSISKSFIEYFIEEYNQGRVIKEVEVELIKYWVNSKNEIGENFTDIALYEESINDFDAILNYTLKLNQQNEISIV